MKSITSSAYARSVVRARRSRARVDSSGKTAARLCAMAARVSASSRHAIHVPTRPIANDSHGGNRLTPR